jgi:hypothetical protein
MVVDTQTGKLIAEIKGFSARITRPADTKMPAIQKSVGGRALTPNLLLLLLDPIKQDLRQRLRISR